MPTEGKRHISLEPLQAIPHASHSSAASALTDFCQRAPLLSTMESNNVLKGLFYGGFSSCVAETGAPPLAERRRRTSGAALAAGRPLFFILPPFLIPPLCSRPERCLFLAATMPVDVVKTRLQMDGSGGSAKCTRHLSQCSESTRMRVRIASSFGAQAQFG